MDWLKRYRRHIAFVAVWALSSVLMGAIIAESGRRVFLHYVFNPEFNARINALYLKARLGLDEQQYRQAYEIMREGCLVRLDAYPRRQAVWDRIHAHLETAPDDEILGEIKELQAINGHIPETNVGMVVRLRNLLPPAKRAQFVHILETDPLRAMMTPRKLWKKHH